MICRNPAGPCKDIKGHPTWFLQGHVTARKLVPLLRHVTTWKHVARLCGGSFFDFHVSTMAFTKSEGIVLVYFILKNTTWNRLAFGNSYILIAHVINSSRGNKARWKTRGRGTGSRGVENAGCGKRGVWWKTRGTIFFAKIWIFLSKMRNQNFVSLYCDEY